MSKIALAFSVELETMECGACGTIFGISTAKYRECRETGKDFYCPNGHCRAFREPDVKRLQKQLDAQIREATLQAQRAANAEKKLKNLNRRVSHGVCPCCGRTFKQLQRHMKSKHPEMVK